MTLGLTFKLAVVLIRLNLFFNTILFCFKSKFDA